jgi:hypothetical protein
MKDLTAHVDTEFPSILHGKVQSGQAPLEWKVSTADLVQVQDFVLRLKRSFPDHFNYKKKEGKEKERRLQSLPQFLQFCPKMPVHAIVSN